MMALPANPATTFKKPSIVNTRSSAFVTLAYKNTQDGTDNTYTFYVPPQEIEINTPSRVTVYQNISGNTFVDNLGAGTTMISFQGTTGFMYGKGGLSMSNRGAGHLSYQLLKYICQLYHEACKKGQTAFANLTLNISMPDAPEFGQWKVTIKDFIVKRSVTEPLLFRYQINFICLSEDTFSATYQTPAPTNVGINAPALVIDANAARTAAEQANIQKLVTYTVPPKIETITLLSEIKSFFKGKVSKIDNTTGIIIDNITNDIYKISANSAPQPVANDAIITMPYDQTTQIEFQKNGINDAYINAFKEQITKINGKTAVKIQSVTTIGTTLQLTTGSKIEKEGMAYIATVGTRLGTSDNPRTLTTIADRYITESQLRATGNANSSKVSYLKQYNKHITSSDAAELPEKTEIYYPKIAEE